MNTKTNTDKWTYVQYDVVNGAKSSSTTATFKGHISDEEAVARVAAHHDNIRNTVVTRTEEPRPGYRA